MLYAVLRGTIASLTLVLIGLVAAAPAPAGAHSQAPGDTLKYTGAERRLEDPARSSAGRFAREVKVFDQSFK